LKLEESFEYGKTMKENIQTKKKTPHNKSIGVLSPPLKPQLSSPFLLGARWEVLDATSRQQSS